MRNKIIWILRVLYLGFATYGIVFTVGRNASTLQGLSFYTVQSNILCAGVMAVLLIRGWDRTSTPRGLTQVKNGATVLVFLTFLVFHFILRPGIQTGYWAEYVSGFDNLCVHYLCPLWFLADYLLFDAKGTIRATDPFLWLVFPGVYYLYVTIYRWAGGVFGGEGEVSGYPYFFLNPEVMGFWGVVLAIVGILAGILVLSFGLYGVDRLMSRKNRLAKLNGGQ